MSKWLDDKSRLLFLVSLCVTLGGWMISLKSWQDALSIGAIGGLLLLLGNNVFANMLKNIGLVPDGSTNNKT